MSEYDNIVVDREGAVAHVTLDSESRMNGITHDLCAELLHAVTDLGEDPDVRCLTLSGSGDAFCAGADLSMLAGDGSDAPEIRRLASKLHDVVLQLHQIEKPCVVGVNGVAAGAGFGLALAGDIVVMSADARLEYAYPRIGFTGDGGSTFLLPRLVGLRRAKEIALLDEPIDPDYAVSLGLVTESVPAEEFEERLNEQSQRLAEGPTAAMGATKRLLAESFDRDLAQQLAEETDAMATAAKSEDFQRGYDAFFSKEDPDFVGR
jgi:2-(1,2-epoxy-1,2-dihydrophenyl)acetyl-CoA isomerase